MNSFPHARLLTRLSYAAMISLSMGMNLLPVYLTALGKLYGENGGTLTNEQLGRFGAFLFSGLVVGILITGPLADRWGAKIFAVLGNALVALSLLGLAYAPGYDWLCVGFAFLGLGAGLLDMVLSPVVSVLNPDNRSSAMNWLHSFYCIGAATTILVGIVAAQIGLGWRGACLTLMSLPLVLIAWFTGLHFPPMAHAERRTPLRALVRERWFALALLAIFLGGAAEMGMAQWLPAFAETELNFTPTIGSVALLFFSVAMALGRMVVGATGKRWSAISVMMWACVTSTILFLLGSFFPVPSVALLCCVFVGFTGSCLWPTTLAVTADRYPNGGATMFGALAALGNAGGIVMPWLAGIVADASDLRWGLATAAVTPAAMFVVLQRMRSGAANTVQPVSAPAA
ncbi:MAG TPA: MFS transporter [Opitutaceae bacterium]|nr:MFS transporter [Opitutaceae bacterium]